MAKKMFSIQLDPYRIPDYQRPATPPAYALRKRVSSGVPYNCAGVWGSSTTTLSEDGKGWVMNVFAQMSQAGTFEICMANSFAYPEPLVVVGESEVTMYGAACLTTSDPQKLRSGVEGALQAEAIVLATDDVWWLTSAELGCEWPARDVVLWSNSPAAMMNRNFSGDLSLCYRHKNNVLKSPACLRFVPEGYVQPEDRMLEMTVGVACAVLVVGIMVAVMLWWSWTRSNQLLSHPDTIVQASSMKMDASTVSRIARQTSAALAGSVRRNSGYDPVVEASDDHA